MISLVACSRVPIIVVIYITINIFVTVRRIIMVCIFRTFRKTSHDLYVIFLKKTKTNLFSSL